GRRPLRSVRALRRLEGGGPRVRLPPRHLRPVLVHELCRADRSQTGPRDKVRDVRARRALGVGALGALALAVGACVTASPAPEMTAAPTTAPPTPSTTFVLPRETGPAPMADAPTEGEPWGDAVAGLLTFRGNPTRTWYGNGP